MPNASKCRVRTRFLIGLVLTLLAVPGAVSAANVCCACQATDNPAVTNCYTIDSSKLDSPDSCATLPSAAKLEKTTCASAPLGEPNQGKCRPVPDGGVCANSPVNAFAAAPAPGEAVGAKTGVPGAPPLASGGAAQKDITPRLNVEIPGFAFTGSEATSENSSLFAAYVAGLYRYALSIAALAATVMFVFGAFRYLIGASMENIRRGKEIMLDAVVGMLLVIGANLILRTINPATVNPKALEITRVATDAYTDATRERARVEQSATARSVEVPVIDVNTGEQVSESGKTGGAVSSEGTVKDPVGNLVAQGNCPSDMVAIPQSPAYTKGNVASFCMDRYEAPNQKGVKPIRGAHEWEAEWYCQERGKRLCNYSEWVRACLGPEGKNTYGYGPNYVEGRIRDLAKKRADGLNVGATGNTGKPPAPCNYDTNTPGFFPGYEKTFSPLAASYPTTRKPELSILNPNNPRLSDPKFAAAFQKFNAFLATYDGSEPSGARPSCVTPEGVFDLTANVSEMTVKDQHASLSVTARVALPSQPRAYNWSGFNWSPIPHLVQFNAQPTCTFTSGGGHGGGDAWRDYINGFRCCLNLNP